jgi:hypothetical protein
MAASLAVTPEPVGDRSTSASAKTQMLRVGRSGSLSKPSVRIVP